MHMLLIWILISILPGLAFIIKGIRIIFGDMAKSKKIKDLEKKCTIPTKGTIVDYEENHVREQNGKMKSIYYFIFEYEAGSRTITQKSGIEHSFSDRIDSKTLIEKTMGAEVDIFYNHENPEELYVPMEKTDEMVLKHVYRAGGLIISLGILLIIICLVSIIPLVIK